MDIWDYFERNVEKVGVQDCPEVGPLGNLSHYEMGPQGFQLPSVPSQSWDLELLSIPISQIQLSVSFFSPRSTQSSIRLPREMLLLLLPESRLSKGGRETWKCREEASQCLPPFPQQTSLLEQDPAGAEESFIIFTKVDRIRKMHSFLKMCCSSG